MTYLLNLIYNINYQLKYAPIKLAVIIVILLLLTIIILLMYKSKSRDYKIYCFPCNIFFVIFYILGFTGILFYLRYARMGTSLELIPLIQKLILIYQNNHLLIIIILTESLIIIFLFLMQIKRFLGKELLKAHLYFYYRLQNEMFKKFNMKTTTVLLENNFSLYLHLITKLKTTWCFENMVTRFYYDYFLKLYGKFSNANKMPRSLYIITFYPIRYIFIVLLIALFIYDMFSYNYAIHTLFYFLPFYFLHTLWLNTSKFLNRTDSQFNFIIYERYYEEDNVLYVNTTVEEDLIFLTYIEQGFRSHLYSSLMKKENEKEVEFFMNFGSIFKNQRRFVRLDKNTTKYVNPNTGEIADLTKIKIEETYE